ncbi:MAG: methionyl-tRNA formyltransferase [Firmicutes bacterium]|nr:methionyl-tRNA formyltransferase [Bacillota bacterium]
MNIVFMGTPEIAVKSFEMLIEKYNVVGCYTQPDRPKGRGKKLAMSPVKEVALKHDIPVYQPKRVKNAEEVEILKSLNPDLIVVIAYGQILSKEVLDVPRLGCVNVHTSLLPKYRGAAPINWAVVNGETLSGVTTMYMDEGLDTGDIIYKSTVEITPTMTAGELHDALMDMSPALLEKTVDAIKDGLAPREKQDDSQSSYAPKMDKEISKIDWNKSGIEICNMVRGFNPWPVAHTSFEDSTLKIFLTEYRDSGREGELGEIVEVSKDSFTVKAGKGYVVVKEVQFPNKKRMDVKSYLLGHEIKAGTILK